MREPARLRQGPTNAVLSAAFVVVVLTAEVAHGQGAAAPKPPPGTAAVGPGVLKLFDPPSAAQTDAQVARFFLDKAPVTNAQFLEFVKAHREWQRGATPRLLADELYLTKWESPIVLGANADPNGPVVRVSWFSARAYCQSKGARLPTEAEWELAARASETSPAPVTDPQRDALILAWYGQPTPPRMPPVMQRKANYWGVYDLHGLIWEWVNDFNSRVVSDGRRTDEAFVCGGGTLRGADKTNYAAFMRMAFRASLRGNFTTADLGFRCAQDEKAGVP